MSQFFTSGGQSIGVSQTAKASRKQSSLSGKESAQGCVSREAGSCPGKAGRWSAQLCPEVPGESQGQGSLVGCHLWGHTELDMTEAT